MTKEEILYFIKTNTPDLRKDPTNRTPASTIQYFDWLSRAIDEYALAMVGEDEGCWYEEGTCGKRAPSCKGCQFTKCKQEIRDRINSK